MQFPTWPFALLPLLPKKLTQESKSNSLRHLAKVKGETAIIKAGKMGKIFQKQEGSRTMVATTNANVKASPVSRGHGGTPVWAQKSVLCVCVCALKLHETTEQKVRKPVLSLISSTLPPPREEAEGTGGGAGCYRSPIEGTQDGPWGAFSYSPPIGRSTEGRGNP